MRALALVFAVAAIASVTAAHAAEHTIVMEGVKFQPAELAVEHGATVVWVNKDPFPHTATARGAFDSKEIAPGKSWKWIARKAGSYDYVCTLHPGMSGKLTVK